MPVARASLHAAIIALFEATCMPSAVWFTELDSDILQVSQKFCDSGPVESQLRLK